MKKWDPNWTAVGDPWASWDNYWAGAKKACDDIGMSLPDKSKLESLSKKTTAEKEQLGLPTSGAFWSSSETSSSSAYVVPFHTGYTLSSSKGYVDGTVLCVGDQVFLKVYK